MMTVTNGASRARLLAIVILLSIGGLNGQTAKKEKIGILSFRLTQNRIVPKEVSVPKGKYLVRISNGVFGGTLSFELVNTSAAALRVADKTLREGKGRDQIEAQLPPGQYELRVGSKAASTAQIRVTP